MYIRKVTLKNIRGFSDFTLEFPFNRDEGPRRSLILGRNGTCKTTLLRAIGIGLSDDHGARALLEVPTGGFIRTNSEKASINLEFASANAKSAYGLSETDLKRGGDRELVNRAHRKGSEEPFACGYGAGRSGFGTDARMSNRSYRVSDSIGNLFDYKVPLADPELTLRRVRDFLGTARYESAIRGLRKVLKLSEEDQIDLATGGGVEITGPSVGGRIPLQAWADGYRLTFGWMLDLYAWAVQARRISESGDIEGILLIDEIEQHLHPSMQSEILKRLSEALPRMQIIATTHSPLVAIGAAPDDVIPLRREGDHVVREEVVPDFRGWSAEDLLVDDRLFDTSPYPPETQAELNKYQDLADIPEDKRSPAEAKELQELGQKLVKQQLPEVRENDAAKELRRLAEKHGL
jgi:hypothetical protein